MSMKATFQWSSPVVFQKDFLSHFAQQKGKEESGILREEHALYGREEYSSEKHTIVLGTYRTILSNRKLRS